MALITWAKCSAPPSARSSRSTDVTTTWARPKVLTARATLAGSSASSAPGNPVFTLQKAQARVQVSPMIIMVACRLVQHSPMLGQPASSQAVRADDGLGFRIAARYRRFHADPVRLSQHRRIRPVGLFRVAERGARLRE